MTAVAVVDRESVTLAAPRVGLLQPLAAPAQVIEAQNAVRDLVAEALVDGRDYGTVPGTDKPTLLKPGAERLTLAFGLAPRFRVVESEIDHDRRVEWVKHSKKYGDKTGVSLGLYRYVVECEIVHRETGTVIASCIGVCSTMESKYVDRPRDVENTVAKMAEKRALVGATLLALGLSEQFTQDVEDLAANGAIDTEREGSADESDEPEATCPKCSGRMWDNRLTKRSPKAPDFKCRDTKCDGVLWPGQWPPKREEPKDEASESDAATTDASPAIDYAICPAGPNAGRPWTDTEAFDARALRTMREYFATKASDADDPTVPSAYAEAVAAELDRRMAEAKGAVKDTAPRGNAMDAADVAEPPKKSRKARDTDTEALPF